MTKKLLKEKNPAPAIIFVSVTFSLIISSIFLRAGAVQINTTGALLPYVLSTSNKQFSGSYITTTYTSSPQDWCGQHYSTNPSDDGKCAYYNTGASVGIRGVLDDGTLAGTFFQCANYAGQVVCNGVFPFINCQCVPASTMLGGTEYIAHDYAATCPSGQVMTGFSWGQRWGNRYALVPECAPLTLAHI